MGTTSFLFNTDMAHELSAKVAKRDEGQDAPSLAGAAAAAPVARSTLDDLLADLKTEITEANQREIQQATNRMENNINTSFARLVRGVDEANQRRFHSIEHDINAIKSQASIVETEQQAQRAELDRMAAALSRAESYEIPAPQSDDFERNIDPSILRINTSHPINLANLKTTVDAWLQKDFAGQYLLRGPEVEEGTKFVVKFKGTPDLAGSKVQKANAILRQDDGKWQRLKATTRNNIETNVFISTDKNRKMVKTEIVTKKLKDIFEKIHPDQKFHSNRQKGLVYRPWKPAIAMVVIKPDNVTLQWNNSQVDESIQKEAVAEAFREAQEGTAIQWSI